MHAHVNHMSAHPSMSTIADVMDVRRVTYVIMACVFCYLAHGILDIVQGAAIMAGHQLQVGDTHYTLYGSQMLKRLLELLPCYCAVLFLHHSDLLSLVWARLIERIRKTQTGKPEEHLLVTGCPRSARASLISTDEAGKRRPSLKWLRSEGLAVPLGAESAEQSRKKSSHASDVRAEKFGPSLWRTTSGKIDTDDMLRQSLLGKLSNNSTLQRGASISSKNSAEVLAFLNAQGTQSISGLGQTKSSTRSHSINDRAGAAAVGVAFTRTEGIYDRTAGTHQSRSHSIGLKPTNDAKNLNQSHLHSKHQNLKPSSSAVAAEEQKLSGLAGSGTEGSNSAMSVRSGRLPTLPVVSGGMHGLSASALSAICRLTGYSSTSAQSTQTTQTTQSTNQSTAQPAHPANCPDGSNITKEQAEWAAKFLQALNLRARGDVEDVEVAELTESFGITSEGLNEYSDGETLDSKAEHEIYNCKYSVCDHLTTLADFLEGDEQPCVLCQRVLPLQERRLECDCGYVCLCQACDDAYGDTGFNGMTMRFQDGRAWTIV